MMNNRILGSALVALLSVAVLGQATPVSSTPGQAQAPAAATQPKGTSHSKTGAHHAKAHHKSHKKHHKSA